MKCFDLLEVTYLIIFCRIFFEGAFLIFPFIGNKQTFLSSYSYATYFQEVQLAAIMFLIFQVLLCYTKLTCLDQLTRH